MPDKKRISRKKFIRLGTAVGLGSAAVPLVSACGGSTGGEPGGSRPLDGGPKVGEGATIAEASGLEPGAAVPFTDAETGQQGVLVHLEDGGFAAYSAVCTHQACTVAYKDGKLACPCHGSVFDPANGAEVLNGPATSPLPEIPVRVEGGEVVRG